MSELSAAEVARRAGITAATLRRWDESGLIPRRGRGWSQREVSHLRMLVGLRNRGHSLEELREGVRRGSLMTTWIDSPTDASGGAAEIYSVREVARELELEPELLRRFMTALGLPAGRAKLTELEMALMRQVSLVLKAGLPLVATLQIARVYSQAMRQIADAEVRLVHLYVHEPMLRDGTSNVEIADTLDHLSQSLMPLASPMLDLLHQRLLQHYIEQDVVGHLEQVGESASALGEMRVAIAFADLAGFTRLTEQEGDLEAVTVVERFFEQVAATLPEDARVIKTIGDEAMVVGSDPAALLEWAVEFQESRDERPLPRIGVHSGPAIFREGDYYGREVNRAARIVTHGAGGEVLISGAMLTCVTQPLSHRSIGEVRLKGFEQPQELFVVERDWE